MTGSILPMFAVRLVACLPDQSEVGREVLARVHRAGPPFAYDGVRRAPWLSVRTDSRVTRRGDGEAVLCLNRPLTFEISRPGKSCGATCGRKIARPTVTRTTYRTESGERRVLGFCD